LDGGIATTGELYAGGNTSQYKVWHAGNDGTGSGLDADTLDGKQLSTIEAEYQEFANSAAAALANGSTHDHTHLIDWPRNAAPFDNAANPPRAFFTAGLCVTFVESSKGWPIAYGKLLNIPSYTSSEDGSAMQILIPYVESYTAGGQFMWRIGKYNNAGWSGWHTAVTKADLDSVQNALNSAIGSKLNASAYTAADVKAKLLTVDGAGSGIDADKLDGQHASYFYSPGNPPPSSAPSTSQVLRATASASVGGVGTYAFLMTYNKNINYNQGTIMAGSSLKYAGVAESANNTNSQNKIAVSNTTSPAGTWRAMGYIPQGGYYYNERNYNTDGASLWLRIS
jgi:hypothetical protein